MVNSVTEGQICHGVQSVNSVQQVSETVNLVQKPNRNLICFTEP